MIEFIINYWIEVACGIAVTIMATLYKSLKNDIKIRMIEQRAMKEAITSLLRQTIYDTYNKWSERGYCPIYAMEVCTRVYEQYHALGGNDVGTELYERLKELPTQNGEHHNEL